MLQRIMLIDDSEGEALFVKKMLRDAGFEDPIFHLRDPEDALAYLRGDSVYANREKFPVPEIVLLDLGMPGIDGFHLLKWIRDQRHLASLNVVVLTGETDPKRIALAYQLGANSYLSKAGTQEEFRNFVRFFRGFAGIGKSLPKMADPAANALQMPLTVIPPEIANGGTDAGSTAG
jgi:DNA-binding response OmpR family regulator